MSLMTGAIPALIGGVSQQSDLVRSTDQLESQLNGWSSIADGLGKRPPTERVARLMETAPNNVFVHTINRNTEEQYVVTITDERIRVFDSQTGQERQVNAPGGWGYLEGIADYAGDLSMFTVADYSFLVNRKKVCAMGAVGDDQQPDQAYQIWVNRHYGTDSNGVNFGPGVPYQYEPNPSGGVLTGTAQRSDKLPETAPEGAIYRVQGDESSGFVSYYLRRSGGVWKQCVMPGLVNAIDYRTMPHALISEADGTFTFAPFSWAPRRLGDEATNPTPGFIGRTIQKVFFYQNRLSFLFDEAVVMSESGMFGNFWRMDQLDYLDTDRIEVGATSTKVAKLFDAVAHNDGIFLTSDQTQFSLTNGEMGLTTASIAMRPTTNYTVNTSAGLAALGSEIYFAVERSGFASIREYTRLSGTDATSAADVTAHCPTYIPAGVHGLIAADDLNTLFALTHGSSQSVYVYQFYWSSSDEKAQSAWHQWDFGTGTKIVSGAYLKGVLFLVMQRADGLWLEKVNLQSGAIPAETSAQIHLDRRTVVTGEFNTTENRTYFTLPFRPAKDRCQMVRTAGFAGRQETLIDPTTYQWLTDNIVSVPGSEIMAPVIVGEGYTFAFQFSKQFVRRSDGVAVTTGRQVMRSFTVNYADTAYFKTLVAPYGADDAVDEIVPSKLADMTGRTIGAGYFKLNTPSYGTGAYRFMVSGQNHLARIRIENDTPFTSTFVSAEWEATYNNRARV